MLSRFSATGRTLVVSRHRSNTIHARFNSSRTLPGSHNPLRPRIPTTDLGLPLHPQSHALPSVPASLISSLDLARLHRLSALNPPKPGSEDEKELLGDLNELVGLMEGVKSVELPQEKEALGELLTQGVGEVVIGVNTGLDTDKESQDLKVKNGRKVEGGEVTGRRLLAWATGRKGDYYHSKASKRA